VGFLAGFSFVRGLYCQQLGTRVALPTVGDWCCLANNGGRRLQCQQLGTGVALPTVGDVQ
jgi:hypothetical protein